MRENFAQDLRAKLISKYQSNLLNNHNMAESEKTGKKGLLSRLPFKHLNIAIAGAGFFALGIIAVLGYMYIQGTDSLPFQKRFGTLHVVKGSATVLRDGEEINIGKDEEFPLAKGDTVETDEDTIADVETEDGRVSMSSETVAKFENDEGDVSVEKGDVYARSTEDTEINLETPDGKVKVDDGASFTSVRDEEGTTARNIQGKVEGSVEKDGEEASKEISEGKQIRIKDNEISDEEEMDREDLKDPLCEHNTDKDEEEGYDPGTAEDTTAPEITVVEPENGSSTFSSKITVKAKSNEDGWAKYNGTWNAIKANEEFSYEAELSKGSNDITVTAKDKYYNIGTATVKVILESKGAISLNEVTAKSNGIFLRWNASGINSNYKYIVRRSLSTKNTSSDPTVLTMKATKDDVSWTDTSTVYGKTYYYHVILLGEDGKEVDRTYTKGAKAINVATPPSTGCSISLALLSKWSSLSGLIGSEDKHLNPSSGGYAKVSWSVSGDCGEYSGFKVVWSQSPNPTYPGDSAAYVDKNTSVHTISGLTSGTWYIRVGTYNGGVTHYSNQVTVTF
ncbi:hypothetical protein JW710_03965 [Candidatus Dojkabacteria bacterium]|nr:hypothetical protein [Candidatus Dojkabacteria bacterium]